MEKVVRDEIIDSLVKQWAENQNKSLENYNATEIRFRNSIIEKMPEVNFYEDTRLLNSNNFLLQTLADSTVIHVYFKELGIIKYERNELYTIIDVIGKQLKKNPPPKS